MTASEAPAPSEAALTQDDETLVEELLREQPSLRSFKRSTLLGMIRRTSSRVGAAGAAGLTSAAFTAASGSAAAAAAAAAAALTVRLAHVAPRLLTAIVGALRTPPPTRSRIFLDELCPRVAAFMATATTAPVSVKDVEAFVELLCAHIAPQWCAMGELQGEVGGAGSSGSGGGGGGGAVSGRARVLAAMGGGAGGAGSAGGAGGAGGARKVFKLTPEAAAGLSGGGQGIPLEAVSKLVQSWAEARRPPA